MGVMMAPDHRFFQTHTKVLYIANKIIVDPVNIPTSCSCIFLFGQWLTLVSEKVISLHSRNLRNYI